MNTESDGKSGANTQSQTQSGTQSKGVSTAQKRPGLVIAVAIINIVFALSCGCSGVMTMAVPSLLQNTLQYALEVQGNALRVLNESELGRPETESEKRAEEQFLKTYSELLSIQKQFTKAFTTPRMKAGFIISGGVGSLLSLLLLISGIGLLCMAGWARKLAIGVSIASIGVAVIQPFVAHAVFGNEMKQAAQNMSAEVAQHSQEVAAILEKRAQQIQAQMDKDPQWAATTKAKADLERTKSLLESLKAQQKQSSATGKSSGSILGGSSTPGEEIFWSIIGVLFCCAWPIACILMLRTAKVRAAFAVS